MRLIVWMLLVSVLAVMAAAILGANDGLVSIYWQGWRVDFSLNLFLLGMVISGLLAYLFFRGVDGLWSLPEKAQQWRTTQRDKAAQGALREALSFYLAARYARSHKAAQKAIHIHEETSDLAHDPDFIALAHLLSAGSLHRLRDRAQRDLHLKLALTQHPPRSGNKLSEEGARLLAAEFAVEDRQPQRALNELASLPPGVARRTQALRIKLQAARLSRQPMEALKAARLLAKHQGFTPDVAQGLIRSLVKDVVLTAHDADQLQAFWQQLDAAERSDPFIASDAAKRMSALGHPDMARAWLSPFWDGIEHRSPDAIAAISSALRVSLAGLEASWLPRLDKVSQAALRIPVLSVCVGLALCERQLWGKARTFLVSAANDELLDSDSRSLAWQALARLAEREHQPEEAARYWRAAATLERPAKS